MLGKQITHARGMCRVEDRHELDTTMLYVLATWDQLVQKEQKIHMTLISCHVPANQQR